MKSILTAAIVSVLVLSSCQSERRLRIPRNEMTIEVECQNRKDIVQTVHYMLKITRVSGWAYREDGAIRYVQAYYEDLPQGKAVEIDARLSESFGVLNVTIRRGTILGNMSPLEPEWKVTETYR